MNKLTEIAERLKKMIKCDFEENCDECDSLREIVEELTIIAEAIAEAMPETTELKTIKPDYEAIMDEYLDTLPSDTARKWASIGFKAGLAVKKSEEL